ncbi:MAG: TldD/PmbA family protein [Candidatus Abyssobacteria bacterium SURF_5]|uniref:TldD/PmbA family protein n=1 Tax=Abyssobacteria bacterium (strain SURF_5) TaxID=2093360 RepID=A0A3A4NX83_ABYX5|nr:MAG: TldD/PmbA family protein [Candidatus Abyssubacteria bacterium SURF_5]
MTRKSDERKVKLAIEAALSAGATEAEGFFNRTSSVSVEVSGGKVESQKVREGSGIGVRVLVANRLGFAYTSDLGNSAIESAARQALANAESSSPDEFNVLPRPSPRYIEIEKFDEQLKDVGLDDRIERALNLEGAARAVDKRITKVRQATASDASYEAHLANSKGISLWSRGTSCAASVMVVAEEGGDAQMGWDFDHSFYFSALDVAPVGRNASRRALSLLGARQIETAKVPIILDAPVAAEFVAAIGHALMADQVQKGKSLFADKVGRQMANRNVTIIDDGMFERGLYPAPADGEGVASKRTVLVEAGVLQGFLYDTYTAAKGGTESTGNGVRSSYASTPEVGATNFYLVPGDTDPDNLCDNCSRGFLVTDAMGMHTIDMVSGDFSVGASGLWIENGKPAFPVRETTIAGNVRDVLMNIEAVARNLKFYSRYGSPSFLVTDVVVSGK